MPSPRSPAGTNRTAWSIPTSAQRAPHRLRVVGRDVDAGDRRDHRAVVVGSPRPGPPPRTVGAGLVEGDDRPADVAWVQVAAADVVEVDAPDDAHAELGEAFDACVEVVDLVDRHVPAVAPALVEQPPGRRALGDRTDHFEELVADGHQRVVQAELGDAWILEAHREAERRAQLGDDAVTVGGDEGDLSEPDHGRRTYRGRSVVGCS